MLTRSTVLLATGNSVVEVALYKGNLSSEKLFDVVVRLKKAEPHSSWKNILVTHVSGKRMIAQGTYGASRGNPREGIALGGAMIPFCP